MNEAIASIDFNITSHTSSSLEVKVVPTISTANGYYGIREFQVIIEKKPKYLSYCTAVDPANKYVCTACIPNYSIY